VTQAQNAAGKNMFDMMETLVSLFSLAAAACWMKSAAVKLPNMTENATWAGAGAFSEAVQRQAKWNRLASLSAALAAISQFVEVVLEHAQVGIGHLAMTRCYSSAASSNPRLLHSFAIAMNASRTLMSWVSTAQRAQICANRQHSLSALMKNPKPGV